MLSKAADRAKLRPAVAALMSEYSRRPIGERSREVMETPLTLRLVRAIGRGL